jgi:hypothetical protein
LGSAIVRPIGVSASLEPAPNESWFRGNRWPPENTERPGDTPAPPWPLNNVTSFTPREAGTARKVKLPPRAWSTYNYGVVLLTEFAQQSGWKSFELSAPPANPNAELVELATLIEFRPGLMTEAVEQRNGIAAYFCGVLAFSKSSHPCTRYLMEGAVRVAQFQAMYHKDIHQRPRPSQLSPGLMPPIDVPGHASYPSGHATEAYTVSYCLKEVFDRATKVIVPSASGGPPPGAAPTGSPLERLAQRIARNREILGLHYPSDSRAGKELAQETFAILKTCAKASALMDAAAREWEDYTN